ncbi:MAG: hypothetical protein LBB61_07090 [Treponema sp.]|jgi:hypothetical protein|nr:hypothetical protein [Treponema sp.]
MKRLIIIALLSFTVPALFADEELDFYTEQFNNAGTVLEQLGVVKTVVNQNMSDADSFYATALNRLLFEYPNVKSAQDRQAADETAILLVQQLGKDKYTESGQNVWRVVKTFSNAMVKSEALIALGQMNATDLLPHVVQLLVDTNTQGPVNRTSGERIAYGAITSLANYKDLSGYTPVFFAANGWYQSWVRKAANETLSLLAEDPAEQLIAVIQDAAYNYDQKLLAIRTIEQSSTSDENKAKAAIAGITFGWSGSSTSPDLQYKRVRIRKMALGIISNYGAGDNAASILNYLNWSYRYAMDEEEQFYAIDAFSKLASDEAVQYLGTYATEINEKKARGTLNAMDERRIRALIAGLGNTQNQNAKLYLQMILSVNWTLQIQKIAQQALNNL